MIHLGDVRVLSRGVPEHNDYQDFVLVDLQETGFALRKMKCWFVHFLLTQISPYCLVIQIKLCNTIRIKWNFRRR